MGTNWSGSTASKGVIRDGDRRKLSDFHEKIAFLYTFFWLIPRRLNFICRRFGTLCLFHLPSHSSHLLAYEYGIECSETSVYKIQTPWNYPEKKTHSVQNRVKV